MDLASRLRRLRPAAVFLSLAVLGCVASSETVVTAPPFAMGSDRHTMLLRKGICQDNRYRFIYLGWMFQLGPFVVQLAFQCQHLTGQ